MDLDFTEEQEMLREMVRAVCVEHSPVDVVRAMEDDPVGFPKALWEKLAEVEVHGILIPESYGGSGMSILDAEVVYEEFGRALAPIPHFVSCVLSASALRLVYPFCRAWGRSSLLKPTSTLRDKSFRAIRYFRLGSSTDEGERHCR